MLDETRLKEIEARCEAALEPPGHMHTWKNKDEGACQTFLVNAPLDIPDLLAEVRRLQRKQAATLEHLVDCVNQGASQRADGLIDHGFLSAYEDAFEFLGLPEDGCTREQLWAVLKSEAAQ